MEVFISEYFISNRLDLNHLLPATKIDEETIFSITKALPPRTFLAIGQATGEYPFIAQTKPLKQKNSRENKTTMEKKHETMHFPNSK